MNDVQRVADELAELLGEAEAELPTGDGELDRIVGQLDELRWVNPHLPIGWPIMPDGLFSKAGAYVKKVVRMALRWYINPIVDQQNKYNEAVARSVRLMYAETSRLRALTVDLEAQLQHAKSSDDAPRRDVG